MSVRKRRIRALARIEQGREVRHAKASIDGRVAVTGSLACSMFGHVPEGLVHLSPALHAVVGECAQCGESMSESSDP